MPATIYFRVGEKDEISLEEFLSLGQDLLKLLRELDATASAEPKGSVRWTISSLSKNSPPEIGVTAIRRPNREDRSLVVQHAAIEGSLALKNLGERPPDYSDAALLVLQRIADKSKKLGPSLIYSRGQNGPGKESRIDVGTAQRVQELTAPRSQAWGTLVGRLDTISIRSGSEFRIIDEETRSPVRCRFHEDKLEKVKELLGARVMASGIIYANNFGSPLRLDVDGDVHIAKREDLPSIDEMIGLVPDLLGGRSLLEYLEEDDADTEPDLLGH